MEDLIGGNEVKLGTTEIQIGAPFALFGEKFCRDHTEDLFMGDY